MRIIIVILLFHVLNGAASEEGRLEGVLNVTTLAVSWPSMPQQMENIKISFVLPASDIDDEIDSVHTLSLIIPRGTMLRVQEAVAAEGRLVWFLDRGGEWKILQAELIRHGAYYFPSNFEPALRREGANFVTGFLAAHIDAVASEAGIWRSDKFEINPGSGAIISTIKN